MFCLVSFSNGFFAKHFFLVANSVNIIRWRRRNRSGSKRTPKASLSIFHWNLNSISAHNYARLSLLKAYLAFHKLDIICLSETYINSSISPGDETLEISGYNLVRSDHPLNSKRRGVFIHCKNYPYKLSASIIYQNV